MRRTAFLLACLAPPLAAQAPPPSTPPAHHERAPDDPIRVQELRAGVHVLYGRGGNVGFLVGPEAVLVVDSQFRDLAPGILRKIREITAKPVRYLVNTHHHGDHVGGNDAFQPIALILAHDNVRRRMLEQPDAILREHPARIEEARLAGNLDAVRGLEEQLEWAKTVEIEEIPAPFLTFDSEFRIHMPGETVELWHTPPAHTDGDSVVYFAQARVAHLGDLFFHETVPVIDVRGGGSATGYLQALDRVAARVAPDAILIPGHGEVTDLEGLKSFRQYIVDLVELARRQKAAGLGKDDFVRDCVLPAYERWSGYERRLKANCAAAWDSL